MYMEMRKRCIMETPLKELIFNIVEENETHLFERIIEKFQKQIFGYCYRILRNKQDAEDATQEVFMKSYENLKSYQYDSSFSAWLYKIAYYHCLNKKRKGEIFRKLLPFIPVEPSSPSAEECLSGQLFSPALESALNKLTVTEQNLIILRIFEEMSFEEIAEIMGKGKEAVKKRYSRTKNKFKDWLQESEGEQYDNEKNVIIR